MKKRMAVITALIVVLLCGCAGAGHASSPTDELDSTSTSVPNAAPTAEPTAATKVTIGSLVLNAGSTQADLSGISEEADEAIRDLIEGKPILRSLRTIDLGGYIPPYELYQELSEAYPGAEILWFGEEGVRPVAYKDTEHYRVTRDFLNAPERMLKYLLEE